MAFLSSTSLLPEAQRPSWFRATTRQNNELHWKAEGTEEEEEGEGEEVEEEEEGGGEKEQVEEEDEEGGEGQRRSSTHFSPPQSLSLSLCVSQRHDRPLSLPPSQFGPGLEEAHDGLKALVGGPALRQPLHLCVVDGVKLLPLHPANQLLGQSQGLAERERESEKERERKREREVTPAGRGERSHQHRCID